MKRRLSFHGKRPKSPFVQAPHQTNRAYIVVARSLSSESERRAFSADVAKWIEGRVARHKFLRGGVVIIDAIPKRYVKPLSREIRKCLINLFLFFSVAGKIIRRELRELAKREMEAPKAKL